MNMHVAICNALRCVYIYPCQCKPLIWFSHEFVLHSLCILLKLKINNKNIGTPLKISADSKGLSRTGSALHTILAVLEC